MWETGKFPESWELATIIPIPKPGKDHTEPTNYRPIALTSCLCKTLERMINARLVWYLEINNFISPVQSTLTTTFTLIVLGLPVEALFWSIHLYPNAKSNLKQICKLLLFLLHLKKRSL